MTRRGRSPERCSPETLFSHYLLKDCLNYTSNTQMRLRLKMSCCKYKVIAGESPAASHPGASTCEDPSLHGPGVCVLSRCRVGLFHSGYGYVSGNLLCSPALSCCVSAPEAVPLAHCQGGHTVMDSTPVPVPAPRRLPLCFFLSNSDMLVSCTALCVGAGISLG